MDKDIFTDIQARIGCSYISDLPYYKRAVWFEMKRLPLADYPKQQLEDFSRYDKRYLPCNVQGLSRRSNRRANEQNARYQYENSLHIIEGK